MASQQDVIKAFMKTLDATSSKGSDAIDEAVQACSNFKNAQAAINKMVSDCKSYIAADSKNGWKNFLLEKCGIDLDNADTGAITGKDAGGKTVKTEESIVPESGSLKNYTKNSFPVNGLTFTLADNTVLSDETKSKEKFIWQGLYTWWAPGALDLIKSSYGYSFTDKDVNFKKITVKFVDDSSTTWLAWNDWSDSNSDGKIDTVDLVINMRYYNNIDVTNPNGKSSSTAFYLDKTLAHELTHTLLSAKVYYASKLPGFIDEGLSELTIGIDNERASDISYLAKNPSVLSKWLNLNSTSGSGYVYEAGYMFLRYLAEQGTTSPTTRTKNITNDTSKTRVTGTASADTINNTGANVTITALGGNDSIYNDASKASIDGGAGNDTVLNTTDGTLVTICGGLGNDSIRNNAKAVIYGEEGADTITNTNYGTNATLSGGADNDYITTYNADKVSIDGGAGNDKIELRGSAKGLTVKGGAGNDTVSIADGSVLIQYASGDGNDSISGFGTTDTLSISGGTYATQISGNDIIVKVDEGAVTLVGAKGKTINIKGKKSDGKNIANNTNKTLVSGTAYADTIENYGSNVTIQASGGNDMIGSYRPNSSVNGGAGNDTIDNTSYGTNVTIIGGAGKDSVLNSANAKIYGGDDADTITNTNLGANATLSGDAGNDYITTYNADNVSINGGAGNDKIELRGSAKGLTVKGGTGNDTVSIAGGSALIQYASGDGNDSISGFGTTDTLSISGGNYSTKTNGKNLIVQVGSNKITLVGAASLSKINIVGPIPDTILTVTNSTKSPVTIGSAIKTVDASKRTTAVQITGNALDNSIYGGSKNDILSGLNGNDYILGNAGDDTIYGGNGKDTILGGNNNDYLSGGANNDSILGEAGDDHLYGEAGDDTVYGGAGKDIIWGGDNNDYLYGDADSDTLYGNDGNDNIYGGKGNDYLWGGGGNDSLWGGDGSDTFVYVTNTGTDKIFDFTGNDMLQILNANGSKGSFINSSFSSNNLTLNISGGGKIIFSGVNSSSTFNINGTTYKVSGSSITKK